MKKAFSLIIALIITMANTNVAYGLTWQERENIFNEFLETLPITVCINGDYVDFGDTQPKLINDRNMVSMRMLFEAMGAEVNFDESTKKVSVTRGDISLWFILEDNIIHKSDSNGQQDLESDVSFVVIDGSVFAPARFVCEALDAYVDWDNSNRRVMVLDKWIFKQNIKAVAPAFYEFLDMPILKLADSSVSHNQQVTFLLEGVGKENMDSKYDVNMSEYINIKDGKIQANADFDLEIDGLFDFYSYITSVLNIDSKKLKNVKLDILMDDSAVYFKTNILKAFEVSPINKDMAENIWFKPPALQGNPLVHMINDKTKSLFDLLSTALFPYENDVYFFALKNNMQNVKFIHTLIKNSVNDNYFTFDKTDNANFSISWNPSIDSINNSFREYRVWQKPFQFNHNQYFYYDYENQEFNFDKKPDMTLKESEVQAIDDCTHDMNIEFSVENSTISLFDMNYKLLSENYNDDWNIIFNFTAGSTNEPQKALEPILMPEDKNVIKLESIYDLLFFPYSGIGNNLLKTFDRYTYDYYYYSYE